MQPLRLVIRYRDGMLLKGTTNNFAPAQSTFHLTPANGSRASDSVTVKMDDLKAVFFVQTFEGKPKYDERKDFQPGDRVTGRKVQVHFRDGEVMTGSVMDYNPKTTGFFLFPADPASNNQRVFVLNSAVEKVSNT